MYARRRNEIDITIDILRLAQNGGARKTHIVYRANLNFQMVKHYLERLISNGLMSFKDPYYFVTEKGERFVKSYDELMTGLLMPL